LAFAERHGDELAAFPLEVLEISRADVVFDADDKVGKTSLMGGV